jgi:hypothetical protein
LVIPYVGFDARLYDLSRGHAGDSNICCTSDTVLAGIFRAYSIVYSFRAKGRVDDNRLVDELSNLL